MITVWSILIVGLVFTSFSFAFVLGWILSFWITDLSYLISFTLVSVLLIAGIYYIIKNKRKNIEKYVFDAVFASLSEDDKRRVIIKITLTMLKLSIQTRKKVVKKTGRKKNRRVPPGESNPHSVAGTDLNPARLPIPPQGLFGGSNIELFFYLTNLYY